MNQNPRTNVVLPPNERSIWWKPSAQKSWHSLPARERSRLSPKVGGLKSNPHPFGVKKLKGMASTYRIRSGDYRVIYELGPALVSIISVENRRNAYRHN